MKFRKEFIGIVFLLTVVISLSGCAVNFYKQNPRSKKVIKELKNKISDLEKQRNEERVQFENTKKMLERRLHEQINDNSVELQMDERGLVIIVSDTILFDSGKAEVKSDADSVLNKVSSIIKINVPNKNIGVYGHTDNVPISRSQWKSNWELSTARATNVLHYLVSRGIPPKKLSATGYGEHRPIASNATAEGRSKNRRVEIVILPEFKEKREDSGNIK